MHRAVIVIIVAVLVLLGAGVGIGMLVGGAGNPPAAAPSAAGTASATRAPTPAKPSPRPTATATATRTVQVPGPTVFVPQPYPVARPSPTYPPFYGTAVWMWAPPVSPIPYGIHVHVHSAASVNSANLAEIYEGTYAGIVCRVAGENVSSYAGSSSNWDYVASPAAGWVADVFLDTSTGGHPNGAVAPGC